MREHLARVTEGEKKKVSARDFEAVILNRGFRWARAD